MNTNSQTPLVKDTADMTTGIALRALQIFFVFALLAVVLFLAAGRLNWTWAWVFLGIYLVDVLINAAFMLRSGRETVAERGRPREKMKDWDKIVSAFWALAQYLALPLVAGLDLRFRWSGDLSLAWHLTGAVIFALGLGLFGWAMITNAFFSTVVRIQSERGQAVCRSGPYRYVRHPGYSGTVLQSLGSAILLGSWWALIPAFLAAACMVARTVLEDRTLQAELPGYRDFAREVRYRLVPGVW